MVLTIKKCHFCQQETPFLGSGHIITDAGVKVNPQLTAKIQQMEAPKNLIQHFLGLTGYYRRFVDHFSEIVGGSCSFKSMTSPSIIVLVPSMATQMLCPTLTLHLAQISPSLRSL